MVRFCTSTSAEPYRASSLLSLSGILPLDVNIPGILNRFSVSWQGLCEDTDMYLVIEKTKALAPGTIESIYLGKGYFWCLANRLW